MSKVVFLCCLNSYSYTRRLYVHFSYVERGDISNVLHIHMQMLLLLFLLNSKSWLTGNRAYTLHNFINKFSSSIVYYTAATVFTYRQIHINILWSCDYYIIDRLPQYLYYTFHQVKQKPFALILRHPRTPWFHTGNYRWNISESIYGYETSTIFFVAL